MVGTWLSAKIGSHLLKTETRDPRKRPHDEFIYVDISSVDNRLFRIANTSPMKGSDAPSRARKVIRKGDVIYATVRPTLKRVAYVPQDYDGQICSTGYCVLRTNGTLHSKFIYFWMLTDEITNRVGRIQRGASYPAIRDSDVKNLEISLAPLPEQRRIAAVLSLVQRTIEQQERLIGLTTELKKALMHKLFREGTRGEAQKQTEIGPIPESWEVVKLGDMAKKVSKGSSPKWQGFQYTESGVLFVRSQNVGYGKMLFTDKAYLPEEFNEKEKRSILKEGDILINLVGASIGRAALSTKEMGGANCNQAVCFVRMNGSEHLKIFIVYFLLSPWGLEQMRRQKKDIARANLSLLDVKGFEIPIPQTDHEIEEVANDLRTIEQKATTHKKKQESLQDLFRTLLHQLMTAEIRVNDLDLEELGLDSEK